MRHAANPGVWECSVKSLSFTVDTAPARPDVQLALEDAKYDAALVSKVEDAKMIPGAFFWETHDAQPDTAKRHNNNADKATYMTLTAHALENAGTPVKPAAP